RLASNSLTECFVFGARAARAALDETPQPDGAQLPPSANEGPPPKLTERSREALWNKAGLERDGDGLRTLLDDPSPQVRLIAASALARTESRGAHLRRDFPARDPGFDHRHVTVARDRDPAVEAWA